MTTHGAARRGANRSYVLACRKKKYQPIKQKAVPPYVPKRPRVFPEERPQYDFWLVQRLERGTRWLGGKFDLDYMGSAEYGFGASRRSLDRMRAAGGFVMEPFTMTIMVPQGSVTRTVYFVGPEHGLGDKVAGFLHWHQNGCRSQEISQFNDIFQRNSWYKEYAELFDRTIAWWSFDDDVLFTLREDVARELLYGLENPAT